MNKLLCAALAIMIALPATLSARSHTRVLTIKKNLTAIKTAGNIEVEYTPAAKFNAVIKADYADDLDKVKAVVNGGTLSLSTTEKTKSRIKVKLAAPAVSSFEASGNSGIEVEGSISGKNVSLVSMGNASVEVDGNIKSSKLTIRTSGNSTIEIDGTAVADGVDIVTSGNSTAKISGLSADNIKAQTSGNSTCKCRDITASRVSAESNGNSIMVLSGKAGAVSYVSSGNSSLRAGMLKADGGTAVSSGNSSISADVDNLVKDINGNSSISNK